MRTLRIVFLLLLTIACFVPISNAATDQISLGGTSSGSVVFNGTGGGNFNIVTSGLSSLALGQGIFGGAFGAYSITQTGAITGTFLGLVGGADTWTITQANPLKFVFGSFLTGNLQLVSLIQSSSSGVFNEALVANLTNLGGSLASDFTSAGGIASITIQFTSPTNLAGIGVGTDAAAIATGNIQPTPEPGTMVLLGSGILGLGGYLRRKAKSII